MLLQFVLIHHVNRHTGGLERLGTWAKENPEVNRHTGGLEMLDVVAQYMGKVNRHTGGLEN